MKKILFVLSVLICISCAPATKQKGNRTNEEETETKKIEPGSFIKKLPLKLAENSGIIIFDNLLWTFNDSGGSNKLYGISFSGEIKKEIEIENAKNVDWEDIAQDKKHIYIGDFGNNNGTRKNQKIYKIEKKEIGKKEHQKIKSTEIKFDFSNQDSYTFKPKSSPFDCEALVEYKDSLYIFTKDWSDRTTTVYIIPKKKGEYKTAPLKKFNVGGLITGADISPDERTLALVGYKNYKPILWIFSDFTSNNFFLGEKSYYEMDAIFDAQTEGVCFLGNDSLLVSCERNSFFLPQVFVIDLKNPEFK